MLPPAGEALVHSPTWVRSGGSGGSGQPVSLVMAMEGEPASRHVGMMSDHCDVLVVLTGVANGLLTSTGLDAPERRDVGYNVVLFAAELASAVSWLADRGRIDAQMRSDCVEAVATATLQAAGCLAATITRHQASRQ
jgi:hypothetical protein